MSKGTDILSFKTEEATFLSNMYPCKIYFRGVTFTSSEQMYIYHKTLDPDIRKNILEMFNPYHLKTWARHNVPLREDWETAKQNVMWVVLRYKFEQNPKLKERLLALYPKSIVEGNYWHDNYWGSCYCDKCKSQGKSPGKNVLGFMLYFLYKCYVHKVDVTKVPLETFIKFYGMDDTITYMFEPDNSAQVYNFLGPNIYNCTLCDGSGEYESEYGAKGCNLCNSRLIPFVDAYGKRVDLDWGDSVTTFAAGHIKVEA